MENLEPKIQCQNEKSVDELNRSIEETQKRMSDLEDRKKETENRVKINMKKEMNRTSDTCGAITKY